MTDKPDEDNDRLYRVINNAVSYVSHEAFVLAQFESVQNEPFPRLWTTDDGSDFSSRMDRVAEHLGGPPQAYLVREGAEVPLADSYPAASLHEAIDVFERSRKSVLRALLFGDGSHLLKTKPDLFDLPEEPEVAEAVVAQADAAFWEHAEAAYIRLSSFWDRLGQVMDFAFFNIRKFDQGGFNSVMDRIHVNAVPMDTALKASVHWKRLRDFQTSEKEDGLKWLLRRRNLIVHSLHLRPVQAIQDEVFKSQFNHLDAAHREKLRPRDAMGEGDLLSGQLKRAANLFEDALAVIEMTRSRKVARFVG